MTISKPNLTRLLAAVIGAAMSAWFVVLYTGVSRFRFEFEHRGSDLSRFNEIMSAYGQWLFVLPVIAMVVGSWLLAARPAAATTFQVVLSATWLLAFAVALFCVLMWQVQNIPVFSHG